MLRNQWLLALGATILCAASPARADDKSASDKKDDSKKDDSKKDNKATTAEDELDPFEDPAKPYRFIGLRFRDAVAPKFIINWFANGGRNVNVPMVGPEFITRRDHLEIAVALMYADYGMDPFLFQGKSDASNAWDLVSSKLKLGYVMIDLMYEIPIEKKGEKTGRVAFLFGGGVGFAGVFGSLYQSQAYPIVANADPGNPSQWAACTSANDPGGRFGAGYCNTRNTHFWPTGSPTGTGANAPFSQLSWAQGGSKPLIFPWLAFPQFAIRYKPIKQFQTKFDFGFSTSGFWFGLSASYGIPAN
jgi:hypothetical protein